MDTKKIMIIDDDSDDRFFFRDALSKMQGAIECMEASGGKEALVLLSTEVQLPNFIFLDINMPRMDGRDCLKQLKGDEKLQNIPVIVYSTYFSEESVNEFQKLGALSYLNKPTDIKKLPGHILDAIGGQWVV
jgi:CheY-like chemotaxis protein